MEKTLFKEEKYFLRIFLFIKRKKRVQYLWIDTWVDSEGLCMAEPWGKQNDPKSFLNHSILFDIEPQIDSYLFMEYLQGARVMMTIQ